MYGDQAPIVEEQQAGAGELVLGVAFVDDRRSEDRQGSVSLAEAWNADPKPFVWTKTADEIFDSIASYLQRTADSGH